MPDYSARRRSQPMLNLLSVGLLLLAAWILGRWSTRARTTTDDVSSWDSGPVVLAIRQIGQLHAASYTMKDVLRQESRQDPDAWVSNVPLASEVVHWATRNEALVAAEGTVEAGLDLSKVSAKDVEQVKRSDGKRLLVVHLPPVSLYPPIITVHVIRTENGPFWRDENIVPKAQARATRMFLESAEKGGIRARAEANAIQTLQALERALGHSDIEFEF